MQLNCGYLTIEKCSVNYYVAAAALPRFSVDKLMAMTSFIVRCLKYLTCSLTATYNTN